MLRRMSLGATVFLLCTTAALACGKERWTVKTGADRDAGSIDTAAQVATIADLTELHAPLHPNSRPKTRFKEELKTFQISGILTVIKKEKDEDYHLIISDADDEEQTMIVESVSPSCAVGSIFTQEIEDVRLAIDQKLGVIKGKKNPNIRVTVTGVAFFDPIHGQEGVAPNGIELHPILEITFQ